MIHVLPLVIRGKTCPRCGSRAERVPTPMLLRPIRWMMPSSVRRRCIGSCGWRGFAYASAADRVRRHVVDAEHEPLHQA
ncbi:MAG TPA: hypothetical protein VFR81_14715 [Longimicrobium sp.]|nr:hypothetical protein [Longimicrobium sp.]